MAARQYFSKSGDEGASAGTVVVYVVYRDGLGAIFDSAYVTPATHLRRRGYDTRVAVLSPVGEWVRPRLRRDWAIRRRVTQSFLPGGLSRLMSPPARWRNLWDEGRVFARWLDSSTRGARTVVLHCGGAAAAHVGLRARQLRPNVRVVFQSWGPTAAEYLHGVPTGRQGEVSIAERAALLDSLDAQAFREADGVICISQEMVTWGSARFGAIGDRVAVVPCFVDTAPFMAAAGRRSIVRSRIGVGDRFVVAFCGSVVPWQELGAIFRLFNAIKEIRADAFFMGLTTSPDALRAHASTAGLAERDFFVSKVPFTEVPEYLSAADVGVIGRGLFSPPSVVNRISSPIKFAEYLAAGVPVILSEGVGDYSALTSRSGVGVVVPHDETSAGLTDRLRRFIEEYESSATRLRHTCQDIARDQLDCARHLPTYEAMYRRVRDHA